MQPTPHVVVLFWTPWLASFQLHFISEICSGLRFGCNRTNEFLKDNTASMHMNNNKLKAYTSGSHPIVAEYKPTYASFVSLDPQITHLFTYHIDLIYL